MAFAETTIYLTDSAGECTHWISGWLEAAGMNLVRQVPTLEDLPWRLRELQYEPIGRPALAVIVGPHFDQRLQELGQRLRRLSDDGRIGLVAITYGAESPVSAPLPTIGYLDLLHAPGFAPEPGAVARLRLAVQLLRERHLRVSREQMYQSQLAQRRVAEARLNYSATHDELTDLANRRAFEKALESALIQGREQRFTQAVLHLDLDRFKLHNDAAVQGAGGDHLLRLVGNLLRGVLPPEYLLARLGSDEFAVLLQGTDEQEAVRVAEQLRASVAAIEPDGEQIVYHVGVSVGVTLIAPGRAVSASQALAQAEQACYLAKTRGGNAVHRFSDEDEALQHLRDDMNWGPPIRRALAENRFFLAFQPILSVAEGRISHYEALLRIPTAIGGDGQSASFMLAAERLGLARQIDLWIVDNAIEFLAGHGSVSLGVNLSSHAFQEPALLPLLHQKLQATEIAPERLTFEITETAAIMNFAETRRMINEIRTLGCRFALDDFGSGFSSYNYIKQFPVDMLKIDGSFVIGLRQDRRDQAIVQSMIDIGHGLEISVVAEFIEDAETYRLLVEMGIDYAQGYYIGRPSVELAAAPAPRVRKDEP